MKLAILALSSLMLAACAPSIKRTGYQKSKEPAAECPVAFVGKDSPLASDRNAVSLGTVSVKDGGFTMSCTEGHMLALVRKEACAQGGNVAVILDAKKPDIWSTCYRVRAEILNADSSAVLANADPYYTQAAIAKRSKSNSTFATTVLIGSVVAGAVAGFLVASAGN